MFFYKKTIKKLPVTTSSIPVITSRFKIEFDYDSIKLGKRGGLL